MSHVLEVIELTKTFQTPEGAVAAVAGVSCEIAGSEFFTMLGPSGCGKTTTLRMIAGLEGITSGRVLFDGQDFTRVPASQRNIGMVFQSYALFPHLTVFENAAYGLRTRNVPDGVVKSKVAKTLELLGLGRLAPRFPADLSGGQQQRVSIARALAYDPGMLLLDEPLANLDAKLRVEMREEIRRIQKSLGILTMYVTHDQEEAMSISDRIAVFEAGLIRQLGRPQDVYDHPASLFVADFIGKANLFPARLAGSSGDGASVILRGGQELAVSSTSALPASECKLLPEDSPGMVMARPENMRLTEPGMGTVECRVVRMQYLGSFVRYVVECPEATREVIVDQPGGSPLSREGHPAGLSISARGARFFHRP